MAVPGLRPGWDMFVLVCSLDMGYPPNGWPHGHGLPTARAMAKSTFLLDIVQKGGGVVHPESKSFEVVLFSPILTLFWTLNGGGEGGFTLFQKF